MSAASAASLFSTRRNSHPVQIEGANFLNLLIVDDDRAIRETCREVAQSLGFRPRWRSAPNRPPTARQLEHRRGAARFAAARRGRPGGAARDQAASPGCPGDCRHRLWHRAVGGAGDERWRLRLRHQALQHGRTAPAAGAGGRASSTEDRKPDVARDHQVAAGLRQHHRARARNGKALPHDRQSRTERRIPC